MPSPAVSLFFCFCLSNPHDPVRSHDTDLTHCFTQGINHTPVLEWIRKRRVKQWKKGQKERKGNQWSGRERQKNVGDNSLSEENAYCDSAIFFSGFFSAQEEAKGWKINWVLVSGLRPMNNPHVSFLISHFPVPVLFPSQFVSPASYWNSIPCALKSVCSLLSPPVWSCYPVYVSPRSNGAHDVKSEVVWFERGAWERRQTQSDFSTSFSLFLKFGALSGTFVRWCKMEDLPHLLDLSHVFTS